MIKHEKIIMTIDGNTYVTAKNAKIVRGAKLLDHFEGELLCRLIKQPEARWLSKEFTENNQELREFHNYLIKEINVEEISSADLPKLIRNNPNFLKSADKTWLVGFYNYLSYDVKNLLGKNQDLNTVQFIKSAIRYNSVYQILLVHIYMKLNMFRATHHPSSGT